MLESEALQPVLSSMAGRKQLLEVLSPPCAIPCCAARLEEGVLLPHLLQLPTAGRTRFDHDSH